MRYSRIGNWLRSRSPLVTLVIVAPLVVVILGLTACVKHPVGDPENSKVDPSFAGVWSGEDTLLLFRPYDSRTYLISVFSFSEEDSEIQAKSRADYKAWLTPIGDGTFLTMEPLTVAHFIGMAEKPPFFVAKIELVDGDLQLRLVNSGHASLKDAQNSSQVETAISENVSSDDLYEKDLAAFEKVGDKARIQAVLDAFPTSFSF